MINDPQILRFPYLIIMKAPGQPDRKIMAKGSHAPLVTVPCKKCRNPARVAFFDGMRMDDDKNVLGHATIFCGMDGCTYFDAYMLPDVFNMGRATLDNWVRGLWNTFNDPDGTHEDDFVRFGGEVTELPAVPEQSADGAEEEK